MTVEKFASFRDGVALWKVVGSEAPGTKQAHMHEDNVYILLRRETLLSIEV